MHPNKFWLLTIAYCLTAIFFALCLSLFVRRLPDTGQPVSDSWLWISKDRSVSLTFTPRHNGLNVITVYLKNVALRNRDPFYFSLSDASGVLRKIDINGYNITDGDNIRFQFPPVADSAGREMTVTLTSDSPPELAIGAGYGSAARSLAYQSSYFPTSRTAVLGAAADDFIRQLSDSRFLLLAAGYLAVFIIPLKLKYGQK